MDLDLNKRQFFIKSLLPDSHQLTVMVLDKTLPNDIKFMKLVKLITFSKMMVIFEGL